MQVPADKAILHVIKVSIVLVCISTVNGPRAIVPLLGHDPDISLDLFNILATSPVIDLKALNINCKLGLNDINCHLPLVNDI
jgi:hypothetical protein